ncbi:MAG: uncharacterized protein PWQ20_1051 [Thermotogaceae bacterium]|jgi:hypothetical protein|nr:uncharacterized protein [Thermotogaceae bacterium]MDN5337981.1 uncharacterized protein [Thermotogaceae bacterium]
MLIGLISDTHGSLCNWEKALKIFDEFGCEKIVHLGDYLYHGPRNPLPECYDPLKLAESIRSNKGKIYFVKGNCDADIDIDLLETQPASYLIEEFNGYRFLFTHGYDPDIQTAIKIAEREKAVVMIHGHTHIYRIDKMNQLFVMNPGSVSLPKNDNPKTIGIIDISENLKLKVIDLEKHVLKEVSI